MRDEVPLSELFGDIVPAYPEVIDGTAGRLDFDDGPRVIHIFAACTDAGPLMKMPQTGNNIFKKFYKQ